ncbi:MAG: HAMP domain-containing sensor histidine kinase [Candidatus Binataceae bacterium]
MEDQTSLEPARLSTAAGRSTQARRSGNSWPAAVRLEGFANLAHELRTPLQVLLGYLDILRDRSTGWSEGSVAEARQIFDRMNVSALELAQTVENLMEFATAEPDGCSRVEEQVALPDLITELMPIFEAANQCKRLALNFELEDAPLRIRSQRRPIRLILLNLVLNAIKFTAAGMVTVSVRPLHPIDGRRQGIEIGVSDTGTGISPAQIAWLCRPFTQLSHATTRRYRGVGLGLAVVRRNVAALDGELEACSTPGAGSVFTVRIPEALAQAATAASDRERTAGRAVQRNVTMQLVLWPWRLPLG